LLTRRSSPKGVHEDDPQNSGGEIVSWLIGPRQRMLLKTRHTSRVQGKMVSERCKRMPIVLVTVLGKGNPIAFYKETLLAQWLGETNTSKDKRMRGET
jgi:hypothetical protein